MSSDLVPVQTTHNRSTHAAVITGWELAQTSPNTLRAYRRNLSDFIDWLDFHGADLLTVKRPVIDMYRGTLESGRTQPSAATIARKLSALSSFYRYAMSADLIDANPIELVRRPKVDADHSATQGMTKDQARALLDMARLDGPRSNALVALLMFTGIRLSEALNSSIADYGHDNGHRTLTVRRKGGKRGKVAVPAPAVEAVNAYLDVTGQELVTASAEPRPIFTTSTGKPWAPSEAFRTVKRLAAAAGIEGKISPHSLRHTFATIALETGTALHDLQDSMGHADPRTTRRYDRARHNLSKSPGYDVAKALA